MAYSIPFFIPKLIQALKLYLKNMRDTEFLNRAKRLVPYPVGNYDPTENFGVLDKPFLDIYKKWFDAMNSEEKVDMRHVVNAEVLASLVAMQNGVTKDFEIFTHMKRDWRYRYQNDWLTVELEYVPFTEEHYRCINELRQDIDVVNLKHRKALRKRKRLRQREEFREAREAATVAAATAAAATVNEELRESREAATVAAATAAAATVNEREAATVAADIVVVQPDNPRTLSLFRAAQILGQPSMALVVGKFIAYFPNFTDDVRSDQPPDFWVGKIVSVDVTYQTVTVRRYQSSFARNLVSTQSTYELYNGPEKMEEVLFNYVLETFEMTEHHRIRAATIRDIGESLARNERQLIELVSWEDDAGKLLLGEDGVDVQDDSDYDDGYRDPGVDTESEHQASDFDSDDSGSGDGLEPLPKARKI